MNIHKKFGRLTDLDSRSLEGLYNIDFHMRMLRDNNIEFALAIAMHGDFSVIRFLNEPPLKRIPEYELMKTINEIACARAKKGLYPMKPFLLLHFMSSAPLQTLYGVHKNSYIKDKDILPVFRELTRQEFMEKFMDDIASFLSYYAWARHTVSFYDFQTYYMGINNTLYFLTSIEKSIGQKWLEYFLKSLSKLEENVLEQIYIDSLNITPMNFIIYGFLKEKFLQGKLHGKLARLIDTLTSIEDKLTREYESSIGSKQTSYEVLYDSVIHKYIFSFSREKFYKRLGILYQADIFKLEPFPHLSIQKARAYLSMTEFIPSARARICQDSFEFTLKYTGIHVFIFSIPNRHVWR